MMSLNNRPRAFLVNLECLDAAGQHDAFVNEINETFGRFDPPAGDRSHLWEIELHGISAEGETDEAAMANWKRLARQIYLPDDIEDDGFITIHPPLQRGAA